MTDVKDPASWYTWFNELSLVPAEYHYVLRMISWFFITLALIPIVPIMGLVIYDLTLWLWRLLSANNTDTRQTVLEKASGGVAVAEPKLQEKCSGRNGTAEKGGTN